MEKKLTPMMRQYMEIKEQYKDFILFYRLGDFYEMFYEDAVVASKVLDITLTKRGSGNSDTPLCGVPFHSADSYIAKMVKNGYKVAICEQTEDPKEAKGIVKREVVRLITPGTVSDLEMLEDDDNSYLCCLYFGKKEYKSQFDIIDLIEDRVKDYTNSDKTVNSFCLSYSDISLGLMRVCEFDDLAKLYEMIYKLNPKEIILPAFGLKGNYNSDDLNILSYQEIMEILQDEDLKHVYGFLYEQPVTITWKELSYFSLDSAQERIKRILKLYNLNSLDIHTNHSMICSCGSLFAYIEETQKMNVAHFNKILVDDMKNSMTLDHFTRANLELTNALRRESKKGTLYWVLNKTDSAMGARLLKEWINSPCLDLEMIIKRQDLVEALYDHVIVRANLKKYISKIYDFERLISKVVYKTIGPKDFIALRSSIEVLPMIRRSLNEMDANVVTEYLQGFDDLQEVYRILDHALLDDVPFSIRDGGVFKSGYHSDLDELREISEHGNDKLAEFEANEREKTGIKNLKVSFNKVFGYYIEISKGNVKNVPEYYIRKQTLVNAERYITPDLKMIEDRVLNAQDKMKSLEAELYEALKEEMMQYVPKIRHMAGLIAYIDAINSLAEVADKNHYTRPEMNSGSEIKIIDGRHPVVEQISGDDRFIPNDVHLDNAAACNDMLDFGSKAVCGDAAIFGDAADYSDAAVFGDAADYSDAAVFRNAVVCGDAASGNGESAYKNAEFTYKNAGFAEKNEFLMIVTGPNMAGKSTYLRQVALICIMAQIGSFVPASEAKLCVVDRVFTRVGASDDLFSAQSTFMVEMNELASILNNATEKSLIILDEIGRGTSTYDGLSIAWAVVEYIAMNIRAKTLFATHYHELTELEHLVDGVCNYYISVIEKNDEIAFLRKIERGGVNKSLGIQVAKLAGVNSAIIERAKELLERLEEKDIVSNAKRLKGLSKHENRQERVIANDTNEDVPVENKTNHSMSDDSGSAEHQARLAEIESLQQELSGLQRQLEGSKEKVKFAQAILDFDLDNSKPIDLFLLVAKLKEEWNS